MTAGQNNKNWISWEVSLCSYLCATENNSKYNLFNNVGRWKILHVIMLENYTIVKHGKSSLWCIAVVEEGMLVWWIGVTSRVQLISCLFM